MLNLNYTAAGCLFRTPLDSIISGQTFLDMLNLRGLVSPIPCIFYESMVDVQDAVTTSVL